MEIDDDRFDNEKIFPIDCKISNKNYKQLEKNIYQLI